MQGSTQGDAGTHRASRPSSEPSSTPSASRRRAARGSSIARVVDTSHSELWTLEDLEEYALSQGYRISILNLTR